MRACQRACASARVPATRPCMHRRTSSSIHPPTHLYPCHEKNTHKCTPDVSLNSRFNTADSLLACRSHQRGGPAFRTDQCARDRQTDRQTETDRDRQTDKQTQTDRDRDRETDRQIDRQTETETDRDRETDRQIDRQTETDRQRQTDRQTETGRGSS